MTSTFVEPADPFAIREPALQGVTLSLHLLDQLNTLSSGVSEIAYFKPLIQNRITQAFFFPFFGFLALHLVPSTLSQ